MSRSALHKIKQEALQMSFSGVIIQAEAYPYHSNKKMNLRSLQGNYATQRERSHAWPGMVVHTYNPTVQEAVGKGREVHHQLRNLSEVLFQNTELKGAGV